MSASHSSPAEQDPNRPSGGWAKRQVSWGILGLLVLTLLPMALVWRWPDATLMHFWLIAQFVPLLYWLLLWALLGAHTRGDDVH